MILGITDGSETCECHRCIKKFNKTADLGDFTWPLSAVKMIVCGACNNKRCPKASDHRLDCSGSNELGQTGSVYA